jgi:hypothetical protein
MLSLDHPPNIVGDAAIKASVDAPGYVMSVG